MMKFYCVRRSLVYCVSVLLGPYAYVRLPLSQSHQRIRSVFQSVYNNSLYGPQARLIRAQCCDNTFAFNGIYRTASRRRDHQAEVRRCSTREGNLIRLPFIKSHSRVLHTSAGIANFGEYCERPTTTADILYKVMILERGKLFETVNRISLTYVSFRQLTKKRN